MATFERYFIKDKETHQEAKGNYFILRDNEDVVDGILDSFGVTGSNRHIINGHVPVHAGSGENPIKANGKLMVIDGGFHRPITRRRALQAIRWSITAVASSSYSMSRSLRHKMPLSEAQTSSRRLRS